MQSLHKYHQIQVRIRAMARQRVAETAERERKKVVLQQYYDLMRMSPTATVDADLATEALAIEAEFAASNQRWHDLQGEAFAAKKQALAEIGKYFGTIGKQDDSCAAMVRFKRWWSRANQYRKSHLDGISLHCNVFDQDGPMFRAFSKALGVRVRSPE